MRVLKNIIVSLTLTFASASALSSHEGPFGFDRDYLQQLAAQAKARGYNTQQPYKERFALIDGVKNCIHQGLQDKNTKEVFLHGSKEQLESFLETSMGPCFQKLSDTSTWEIMREGITKEVDAQRARVRGDSTHSDSSTNRAQPPIAEALLSLQADLFLEAESNEELLEEWGNWAMGSMLVNP
jgi:hypothetical protein